MTKIMITIVFLLLSVASFAQNEAKNYTSSETLLADIRGIGCHGGSGLCSIMYENKKELTSIFITKESFNTIILIINLSQLSIEEQTNSFGKECSKITINDKLIFIQEEDFILDEKSLIYLGLESKYTTIKKGSYPCEIIKDKVYVKMSLLEN